MIASLKGHVQHVGAEHAVIEVGGVGYLVQVSGRTLGWLEKPEAGSEPMVFLFIETHVREDAITLFGFRTAAERDLFRKLQTVKGLGGRIALAVLGTLDPDEFARAIHQGDQASLSRVPGVGPRLAARLITEMKGQALPVSDFAPSATPTARVASADAVSALENLGFRTPDAARAVAEAERELGTDLPASTLIREALKRANR